MRSAASFKTCFLISALLLAGVATARAGEIDDSETIGLFSEEQPVVATSPIPRPISKIAENVTVVTADDIVRLNAHTLADVLQTVPGIQLGSVQRTPGAVTFFNIQGADSITVLVLIDGIRQNDFDQDVSWPNRIPVQQIERIEIVKGAASGSWGSAIGGVVNVVTKTANPERPVSGMVSSSIGRGFTSDSRAELSGTKERFGYYLTAGLLRSDGLNGGDDHHSDNLYGKLSYTLASKGTLTLGGMSQTSGGVEARGNVPPEVVPQIGAFSVQQVGDSRQSYGFLRLQQPLPHSITLDLSGYLTDRHSSVSNDTHSAGGSPLSFTKYRLSESLGGVNSSLSWGDSRKNLVVGGEYLHGHGHSNDVLNPGPPPPDSPLYRRSWDSFALYCNGAYSIGNLSVLPGVRYDGTGISGDHTSYSLGLTYRLAEQTTLRAYGAKGFSLPMLARDTGIQEVSTLQGGVETGAVPFLWLKATYFFNDVRHAPGDDTTVDQERKGVELEARTAPFHGFTLAGGYTYLYAESKHPARRLQTNFADTVPSQVYKLALYYDRPDLQLHGALTGSGVDWNAEAGMPARSSGMLWDVNLGWQPALSFAPELFFTAHNLFSGTQTLVSWVTPTPGRWYEGGARFRF